MSKFMDTSKRFLWVFVELGFLTVLAIMLIYLILGENSGRVRHVGGRQRDEIRQRACRRRA